MRGGGGGNVLLMTAGNVGAARGEDGTREGEVVGARKKGTRTVGDSCECEVDSGTEEGARRGAGVEGGRKFEP